MGDLQLSIGEIKPGTKAKTDLWFMFDVFDLTSSNDIETMDLTFTVLDTENNYSTLFEAETGAINLNNLNADTADTSSEETDVTDAEEVGADNEATETEAEKESKWIVMYFVDDFGDPDENDPYVSEKTKNVGTFSNSATAGSDVYAYTIVEDHFVSQFLYEYGRNPVVNSSSRNNDEYEVKFKDEDGNLIECFGIAYPLADRIWLVNDTGVTNAKDHTDYFTLDGSSKILDLLIGIRSCLYLSKKLMVCLLILSRWIPLGLRKRCNSTWYLYAG